MLLLEARGKKILTGICAESGKILHQSICETKAPVFEHLKSTIEAYDPHFNPSKIGVTVTPGNPEFINESIRFAKQYSVDLYPLHHIDAHFSFMDQPFLGFISNTTNTEILVFNGKGYEILGMDIDIPLGKAFYDLSSLLSVDWNHINAEDYSTLIYPVPMTQHKGLDFSFAGSYFYTLQHIYPHRNLPARAELLDPCFLKSNILGMNILACSFLKAVTTQVQNRIAKAIKWGKIKYPTIKSFAFTGGVSNNVYIKNTIKATCDDLNIDFYSGNSKDSIEMLRDCIMKKDFTQPTISPIKGIGNYPIGLYKVITD